MRVALAMVAFVLAIACQAPAGEVIPASATAVPSVAAVSPSEKAVDVSAAAPSAHHCEGSPVQCGQNAAPPMPKAAAGGKLYGEALDQALALTPLVDLIARPGEYASKTVVTRGTIGRVCQQRGCWMELRAEVGESVARVPMAGHAFFVPSDSSGRAATVQGVVSVREGTDNPLRIDATAVLIADAPQATGDANATRSN